ncbi:flagellar hook-associated protein FlgK [Escherichia coli]|nr:flagellar hook-associated protein FlgK [Escherichia coli]
MISSLWIAKTGLDAQQTNMDVIANNLANVSTNGFKRQRAVFEDLLYQTIRQPGAQSSEQTTLPSGLQIGTGVRPVATERLHSQGNLSQTNNSKDVAIKGQGFFQVMLPDGSSAYTRDGSFQVDQRDQLVSELNQIVGVEVSVQDGGTYNITMANGYSLVQGSTARQLAAVPSSADPSRTTVAYVDGTAGNIEIPEKLLNTGSLDGILTFRSQDLDQTRNTLGQLALAFAEAFNTQHKAGFDANGDAGEDFFAIGKPAVLQNTKNKGDVAIGATVTDASAVLATDYKISFDNNQWQVTRLASNTTFTVTPDANGKVAFDGLELTFTGTPAVNDSFTLKPVSDAIVNMDVLITDEAKIAMASEEDAGDSDNRNGQALLDLQSNSKTVGGAKSFNDAYASLVSDIGNKTATLKTSSATQGNVVTQLSNQQQSISGVNLDEEYGNLQRFQQYYLANAQVLQTANAIFDALINIR